MSSDFAPLMRSSFQDSGFTQLSPFETLNDQDKTNPFITQGFEDMIDSNSKNKNRDISSNKKKSKKSKKNSEEDLFNFNDWAGITQTQQTTTATTTTTPPQNKEIDPFEAFTFDINPTTKKSTQQNKQKSRRYSAPPGSLEQASQKLKMINQKQNLQKKREKVNTNTTTKTKISPPIKSSSNLTSSSSSQKNQNISPVKKSKHRRRHSVPVTNRQKNEYNVLPELHRGTALLKYGRRGDPHFRQFQLSKDNSKLQWFSKKKKIDDSAIDLNSIDEVIEGQNTKEFRRFNWKKLEPASFAVIYNNRRRSLSLVAKSIDEQKMWVQALRELSLKAKNGEAMNQLEELKVDVDYRDRNRPQSRNHSGSFLRGHETKDRNVNPILHQRLIDEISELKIKFKSIDRLTNHKTITSSHEYDSISQILSELEERIEELEHEVLHTRDTKIAENDVWRIGIDLQSLEDKIQVLLRQTPKNGKRRFSLK